MIITFLIVGIIFILGCIVIAIHESKLLKAMVLVDNLIDNLDTTHIDVYTYSTVNFRIYGTHPNQEEIREYIEKEMKRVSDMTLFGIEYKVTVTWCSEETYGRLCIAVEKAVDVAFKKVKWPLF